VRHHPQPGQQLTMLLVPARRIGLIGTNLKLVQPELQLQALESWRAATFSADQGFPDGRAAAGR
jgi:hypothetical protein